MYVIIYDKISRITKNRSKEMDFEMIEVITRDKINNITHYRKLF